MKNSQRIAFCSIVTALSVVLLFLGGITFVLAYAMPMLVGLLMIMLSSTFGASSAWITYAAVSGLSFILVNDKECMLMYVMFFGYYPIIKPYVDKIKIKPVRILLKLAVFNAMLAICQLILVYVFSIPFLDEGVGKWFIAVFAFLMNLLFLVYDRLISSVTVLYKRKIEKRIKKIFK